MTDVNVADTPAPKKTRAVENIYIDSKGGKAARPQPDVVAVAKYFIGAKYTETLRLDELRQEQLLQAAAFGLQQVGQNAYGAAGDDNERIEMLQERWGTIRDGSWSSERASGFRTTDIVEAYLEAKQELSGKVPTDEDRQRIKGLLDEEKVTAKGLLENPHVAAKYQAIKARRAAERANAAAKAASEADMDALPDL